VAEYFLQTRLLLKAILLLESSVVVMGYQMLAHQMSAHCMPAKIASQEIGSSLSFGRLLFLFILTLFHCEILAQAEFPAQVSLL